MNIKIANHRLIIISGITLSLILSLSTASYSTKMSSNNTFLQNRPIEKQSEKPVRDSISNDGDKIYDRPDVMPQFSGGESALLEYIRKNITYPVAALKQGIQGRVIVRFVINKSGRVEKVEIARPIHPACDKEAARIVKSFPKWIPGKLNGENVSVFYVIPINFKIQ